jgi:raffinose/stachyose/melibiose transport system permease protein
MRCRAWFSAPGACANPLLFSLARLSCPSFILLFPVYRITIALHLINTYPSLILPYVATSISFNTLLFTGFLRSFLWRSKRPPSSMGVPCGGCALRSFSDDETRGGHGLYLQRALYVERVSFAVTLISSPMMTTISLGISQFQGMWSIDYRATIAAGILIIIPQLAFYGFFQRSIVEGMTAGAVRGSAARTVTLPSARRAIEGKGEGMGRRKDL